MKVVCESCQAKYQVPDERVAGKKLKIRCKRCGATVLIRGDLLDGESAREIARESAPDRSASSAGSLAAGAEPASREIAGYEWHVSLDGDTRGPFSLEELRAWLNATPGGWDAHVWHEGFQDWMDARACAELEPPALPVALAVGGGIPDDDLPPETLPAHVGAGAQFLAEVSAGTHGQHSQFRRSTGPSALRARSVSGFGEVGAARASSPAHSQTMTDERLFDRQFDRQEESVLFSSASLQTMTGNSAAPSTPAPASTYVHGPNPGFATGEGSGLIDIRALASLARQSTTQLNPGAAAASKASEARNAAASALSGPAREAQPAPEAGFSFGSEDYARPGTAGLSSAYARVDSLAPISHAQTSNAALPLAILGGCALVAAAVLAAVLFTRSSRDAEMAAAQMQESQAASAQPSALERESSTQAATDNMDKADKDARKEGGDARSADSQEASEGAEGEDDELAAGKAKRQPRSPHTVVDEKKNTAPEEKAKPKKEEKQEPSESGDVMLAERARPVKPAEAEAPAPTPTAPTPAPAAASRAPASSDMDELLKHAARPAAKSQGGVDDLLSGIDKSEKSAPAPAAKAAAAAANDDVTPAIDLPELPSRDETLAAMRGVEAAVRACAAAEQMTGTAEVAVVITGATGRVTSATVTGITGNVGSCIARAVRGARFPHFSKATFSIKYPYRF